MKDEMGAPVDAVAGDVVTSREAMVLNAFVRVPHDNLPTRRGRGDLAVAGRPGQREKRPEEERRKAVKPCKRLPATGPQLMLP